MRSKASAPGKVILFGEHFVVYGVQAVLCAIDRRITVSAETTPGGTVSIRSGVGTLSAGPATGLGDVDPPLRPLFYLARRISEEHGHGGGVSLDVESELPPGAGLGSSSAACVAGAAAVSGLFGEPDREEVLGLAIEAERTAYPASSGADCTVCTHGGIMRYSREGGFSRVVPAPGFRLVVASSGAEHSTADMVSAVRGFRERNAERFSEMCGAEGRLVESALRLIAENDLAGLGRCVTENQGMLEEMGVSSERLGEMVAVANETSFGGKITGAGGGGCIFALSDEAGVRDAVRGFRERGIDCFPTGIDFDGLNTF